MTRRWRRRRGRVRQRRTIRCGGCRCGRLTIPGSIQGRQHQQRAVGRLCGLDHLRAVPAALCRGHHALAARRYLRLDAVGQTGAPRGRRMPGGARDLPSFWANAMHDPRLTPARGDLAAKYLEGTIKAARFVAGEEFEDIAKRSRRCASARRPRQSSRRRRCWASASPSMTATAKALRGASSTATAMSAGCPTGRWQNRRPRRRTRSRRTGRLPFPALRSNCRRSIRLSWERR